MTKLAKYLYQFRFLFIILCWLITGLWAWQLPKSVVSPEIEAMIPRDMPSRISTDSIEVIFGGSNMLMIIMEAEHVLNSSSLERLEAISWALSTLDAFERIVSPFNSHRIYGDQGMMRVDPAIPFFPVNPQERDSLESLISENSLVYGQTISKNFQYASIIGLLPREIENTELLEHIQEILDTHPGPERVWIGGLPAVNAAITQDVVNDLWLLLPLALLVMILVLWLAFRSWSGIILPLSVVLMSTIMSMGLIPLLGWQITIVTVLLPVMLIAIANNYGIHILNWDQELTNKEIGLTGVPRIKGIWRRIGAPVILTGLTTIAGILGLLGHIIIPAKQVGILASAGIIWALAMSLLYIPVRKSMAKLKAIKIKKQQQIDQKETDFMTLLLARLASFLVNNPILILICTSVLVMSISIGALRLKVDGDTLHFFKSKHEIRTTSAIIDQHFGGSQTLLVQFSGDIRDPKLLNQIDSCAMQIKKLKTVGHVLAITDIIKEMSQALVEPDHPNYGVIPDSRNAVSQYFELYGFSADPSDFEQLVDFTFTQALLIIRLNQGASAAVLEVHQTLSELLTETDLDYQVGGIALISSELTNNLISGQKRSLIWALIAVVVLVALIFRSLRSGALSFIPLGVASLFLFGTMGWLNIPLDAATALLSSVMIGVGVDYTIHFLWRYRIEIQASQSVNLAIIRTVTTTGRGIVFNALTVIAGFSILLFSSFKPIQFFGLLTMLSIMACLLGALIIIPVVLKLSESKKKK